MTLLTFPPEQLFGFLFLLARCSGIFVFTPFFGSLSIPMEIRAALSVVVSYLFALSYQLPVAAIRGSLTYMVLGLAGELLIGMAIGFAAQILFAGLQFAGQIVGLQMGLSLVNTIDPQSSSRTTTISLYETEIGFMLFLGLNGHHWFIQAIANSLTALPPFSMSINERFIVRITELVAQVFVIGFQVAAPVMAVLFLTDIALGIVGRSAPQIHILIIGLPLKILAGVLALGLALYVFPAAMRGYSAHLQRDMSSIIQLLRN